MRFGAAGHRADRDAEERAERQAQATRGYLEAGGIEGLGDRALRPADRDPRGDRTPTRRAAAREIIAPYDHRRSSRVRAPRRWNSSRMRANSMRSSSAAAVGAALSDLRKAMLSLVQGDRRRTRTGRRRQPQLPHRNSRRCLTRRRSPTAPATLPRALHVRDDAHARRRHDDGLRRWLRKAMRFCFERMKIVAEPTGVLALRA